MRKRESKAQLWDRLVSEQRAWIARCGGDIAGYISHYGSEREAEHYGHGGERIYEADVAYLRRLEGQLAAAVRRQR